MGVAHLKTWGRLRITIGKLGENGWTGSRFLRDGCRQLPGLLFRTRPGAGRNGYCGQAWGTFGQPPVLPSATVSMPVRGVIRASHLPLSSRRRHPRLARTLTPRPSSVSPAQERREVPWQGKGWVAALRGFQSRKMRVNALHGESAARSPARSFPSCLSMPGG